MGKQSREKQIRRVKRLKEKGYSNVAIAERLGISESTVRTRAKEEPKN